MADTIHTAVVFPGSRSPVQERAVKRTFWIAGVFWVLVILVMAIGHWANRSADPLQTSALKQATEQLRADPKNEKLKQEIRTLDLQIRRRYFRQLFWNNSGGYLVLAGLALFLLAAKQLVWFRQTLPAPQPRLDHELQLWRNADYACWTVAALSGLCLGVGWWLVLTTSTALQPTGQAVSALLSDGAQSSPVPAADCAPLEELKRHWPRFRGWDGSGHAPLTNFIADWNLTNGAGVLWKVPVPAPGFNSPIVWNNRFYFTGADEQKRQVFCFDAATGQQLWVRAIDNVPGSPKAQPDLPAHTGFAPSTMATDGRRVYAIFPNGDLSALTLEGHPVWSKNLGVPDNPHGHAASLATWQDRLIVQFDQGEGGDGKSKLLALDGPTGQIAWQRQRPVPSSWATPIVIESGRPQIITLGVPWVISYGVQEGIELWRADCLSDEVTSSPIFANNLVYVISPSLKFAAIRPDGQGDVTQTHVAWVAEDNVPNVTSPICVAAWAFTLDSAGILTCYQAQTGQKIWEHNFHMEFDASPVSAGNRIYLFAKKGGAFVVEAGPEFKQFHQTDMDDTFYASPAFAGEGMILRGLKNFICLGLGPPGVARAAGSAQIALSP